MANDFKYNINTLYLISFGQVVAAKLTAVFGCSLLYCKFFFFKSSAGLKGLGQSLYLTNKYATHHIFLQRQMYSNAVCMMVISVFCAVLCCLLLLAYF